ncbi:MAG: TfoX/Sxy family protein [Gammaproteobacteria bacterium]|nr:TfoX/Sxy family protein [Gammaproteobacteria bacterium]MDH5692130.1 TfoX/Sxy family protein [Gammaproteobacteria bacterium]
MANSASDLAKAANLGPKSAQWLIDIGIDSLEKLKALGSVRALIALKTQGKPASLNMLYAMEGAITGVHWQKIAKEEKARLLLELDALNDEAKKKPD